MDDLELDVGVFPELLVLGVHTLENSAFELGNRVAIAGPGAVGIGTLVAVVAVGAGSITVISTDADVGDRLPLATELGAMTTVTAEDGLEEGAEFDASFEASGSLGSLSVATDAIRPGGELV